jgi:hypothetical protein
VVSLRPPLPASTAQAVDQNADDLPDALGPRPGGLAQLGYGVQEVLGADVVADRALGRTSAVMA